jgi:hypothetical protein
MFKQISKLSSLGLGLILSTVSVHIEPARAARFQFSGNTIVPPELNYLFFENSNLTGVGQESVTLSELAALNAPDSYGFGFNQPIRFGLPTNPNIQIRYPGVALATDPIFTFADGQLTGIEATTERYSFEFPTGGPGNPPGTSIRCSGGGVVKFQGDIFNNPITAGCLVFGPNGSVVGGFPLVNPGPDVVKLEFETLEPVTPQPIPEPMTLLGTATAFGFCAALRKRR